MSKCKWCGKEVPYDHEYCSNWGGCADQFWKYKTRKIIVEFAQAMEEKMQEKDEKGYTYEDKSLESLVNKLKEERDEVDFELVDLPSFEINDELVDEAIMCMLVKHRIKNLTKGEII